MAKTASRVLRTGGLWFDGVANYVNVPSTSTLSGLNNITVMAWVCPTKTTEGTIVSKHDNVNNREWMLYINPYDYKYHFLVYDEQARTFREVAGSLAQIGVPVFLTGTYDGSVLRIYENAVLKSQVTTDIVIRPRSAPIRIGNRADNARFYGGIIDEPRIYNRALSSYEISEIYTKDTFIKDGLILYLPFYEGEGNIAHDVSGYGNHGTIYGGAMWVVKKSLRVLPKAR